MANKSERSRRVPSVTVAGRNVTINCARSETTNTRGRPKAIRRDDSNGNPIRQLSLERLAELGTAFSIDREIWHDESRFEFVRPATCRIGRPRVVDGYWLFEGNLLILARLAELSAAQRGTGQTRYSRSDFLRERGFVDPFDAKTRGRLARALGVSGRDIDFAILFAATDFPTGKAGVRLLCVDLSRPVLLARSPDSKSLRMYVAMNKQEAALLP